MRLTHSNKIILILLLTFFTVSLGQTNPRLITYNIIDNDPYTKEIIINFTVPKKDFVYKDFITFSVDNPAIHLSAWKANKQSIAHYDSSFKEAKQVFNEDFTITMTASIKDKQLLNKCAYLYCSYYRKSEKKINHLLIPLLFTIPTQVSQEYNINTNDTIENDSIPRTKQKINYLDNYIAILTYIIHVIMWSLKTDYKKYFALLMFLIIVFISFLYFFRKELKTQIKIKELIEIITAVFIIITMSYALLYTYSIEKPFITTTMACFCSLCMGLFYIKKSTNLQSARLSAFCTFIGILCICGVLFLSFKIVQYADDHFNLF